MTKYNVTTGGGEVLNLDGPFETREQANEFAAEVERDNVGTECRIVETQQDDE